MLENNILSDTSWIGVPEEQYVLKDRVRGMHGIQTAYFRKSFRIESSTKLTLYISANSRYRLWINGRAVTSGPCKGDRWRHYYEMIDVSHYLKEGENLIAVKVVAYPPSETTGFAENGPTSITANAAGVRLIVAGICMNEKGEELCDISTGKVNWKAYLDDGITWTPSPMTQWMGAMESVEGGLIPYGYRYLTETEGVWSSAQIIESSVGGEWVAPYGIIPALPLKNREIPLMYEKQCNFIGEMKAEGLDYEVFSLLNKEEVELMPLSKYVVELNAGEITTGYFNLKVREGKGSKITIKYAESYYKELEGKGIVKVIRDDEIRSKFVGHEDIYYPSGRDEMYEPFWFRTFRFVRIEIEVGKERIYLQTPKYLETGYPIEVMTTVESSTEWINPLWNISLRTLKRCMHETYEDCPYYEQLQYTMDTRLQILFTYMVSGDVRLSLKAIEDYAYSILPEGILQSRYPSNEPQVIPVFSLYWIMMIEDYYIQTGDESLIKKYRSTIDGILNWYDERIGNYGLVENLGYWEFIDWVKEWTRGEPDAIHHGPSTTHNLVYASALKASARLNRLTGRLGIAEEYEYRSENIISKIEELCWSEEESLYKEAPNFNEFSVHAQVWAVLSETAGENKAKVILRTSLERKEIPQCSYAMSFFLFRALEAAGIYEDTENLWDMWKEMLRLKLTTTPEDPIQPRSDCHGWGALPLFEFTRNLLGVKPGLPGWEEIIIEPRTLSLKDMKGKVITPKGIVEVEWVVEDNSFRLSINTPKGVPCKIKLPNGSEYKLSQGGKFKI